MATDKQAQRVADAEMAADQINPEIENLKRRVASIEDFLGGVATKADLAALGHESAGELAERMKTFLDKYVPHEQPARENVVEVVRDPQGLMRNRQGDVVPYQTDGEGKFFDRTGTPMRVMEGFPTQPA